MTDEEINTLMKKELAEADRRRGPLTGGTLQVAGQIANPDRVILPPDHKGFPFALWYVKGR